MILEALQGAESIVGDRPPEAEVAHYGPQGITYRVKYWVPQHDREPLCRNEVLSLIDAALRARGTPLAPAAAACAACRGDRNQAVLRAEPPAQG